MRFNQRAFSSNSSSYLASFLPLRPWELSAITRFTGKLDALHRRFPNENAEPATFIRHYEDAARILAATSQLPPLRDYADLQSLAAKMLMKKQIAVLPAASMPAFAPDKRPRGDSLRRAMRPSILCSGDPVSLWKMLARRYEAGSRPPSVRHCGHKHSGSQV
jgi:hypothetical protein